MSFTTQSNHYFSSNSSFIRNELIITSQRINHYFSNQLNFHSHRAWHPVRYWTKIPTTFLQAVGTLFLPFLVLLSIRDSDPLGNQQFVCKSRIDDTYNLSPLKARCAKGLS